MEFDSQSFIPKSTITDGGHRTIYKEAGAGIFLKSSVIILFISLVAFGGVLYYQTSLKKQIDEYASPLERAKSAIDTSSISNTEDLARKLAAANELMYKHRAMTHVFDILEETVYEEVRFNGFIFKYVKDQNIQSVALEGEAKSFTALAKQAEVLKNRPDIQRESFSNFVLTDTGNISFSLKLDIKLDVLKYD